MEARGRFTGGGVKDLGDLIERKPAIEFQGYFGHFFSIISNS